MSRIIPVLIILFIIGFIPNSNAQKAKLGDLKVKTKYLNMPSTGLDTSINSYTVKFNMDESFLTLHTYKMDWFKKTLVLPGYPQLDHAGDIIIEVTIGVVTFEPKKKITREVKPEKGTPYKLYSFQYPYKHNYGYKIIDRETQKVIYENNFDSGSQYVYNSPEYRTTKEANEWLKKNRNVYDDTRKDKIRKSVYAIANELKYKFGYENKSTKVKLKRLKSKKHPQYNDYLKINSIVEDAYNNNSDYYSTEEFKTAIKPAIDFWTENESKYDGKDKYQKKLKYACELNLARTYFWMDEFEKAKIYAKKVAEGNYKSKYGKKFLKTIDSKLAELAKVHRTRMHFKIKPDKKDIELEKKIEEEIKEKITSGDAIYFPNFNKKLGVSPDTKVKKIELYYKEGKVLNGYTVYTPLSNRTLPNFVVPSLIRIGYVENDTLKRTNLNYSKLDSFKIEDDLFEIKNTKVLYWKVSDKQKNLLVNVIKDFNKTQLIKAFTTMPINKSNTFSNTAKLLVYNKTNKKYYNVNDYSLVISFPKLLSYVFKDDCPVFADKVKNTKYNKKELIAEVTKVLEEYDKCKE